MAYFRSSCASGYNSRTEHEIAEASFSWRLICYLRESRRNIFSFPFLLSTKSCSRSDFSRSTRTPRSREGCTTPGQGVQLPVSRAKCCQHNTGMASLGHSDWSEPIADVIIQICYTTALLVVYWVAHSWLQF